MEGFEYMKANGVIFNKLKGKRESYFANCKNNNSRKISDNTSEKQIA